ncbi:hypothetical protein FJ936_09325 [Mesorhizobium sp. B2-4-13]|uniref:hypothetical protein n=1 Tax=Mesorhizobium sp. B2-4-13 TaxID=2589936 RepID=UPI001152532D|nr:hypothetical protein [Mesorhizobium sp. B2-4-13]TPK85726.1 hypothetical protein FJ936_09325 [Mesorhizobium sp. B2-4-13]
MITAVDFSQGIGSRPSDRINATAFANAYFVARAAVAELVSLGVKPDVLTVGNTSVVDKRAVGSAVDMLQSEVNATALVQFSHENYCEGNESAIAVSAVASIVARDLKLIDNPAMAFAYYSNLTLPTALDPEYFHACYPLSDILQLIRKPEILEIIPGGSRGVAGDIVKLCDGLGYAFESGLLGLEATRQLSVGAGPACKFLVLATSPVQIRGYDFIGTIVKKGLKVSDRPPITSIAA